MSSALIIGVTGQDGRLLADLLQSHGTIVWGASRKGTLPPELASVLPVPAIDLRDQGSLVEALTRARPDEIYHLAAQTSVERSHTEPVATAETTGVGVARVLEAARQVAPRARIFIPSSSEIFGVPAESPQHESTPIRPTSPYGAAKVFAQHLARIYRRRHDMFVAVGILYNHESPRRPSHFVTRKISLAVAAIARGEASSLPLGNLDASRDWTYAGDVVRAMRLMLQHHEPADFVIASGQSRSVRDWCEIAFRRVGLDYHDYVESDPALWRPAEEPPLVGDATKARTLLGWQPTVSFPELVHLMVDADLARGSHHVDGDRA